MANLATSIQQAVARAGVVQPPRFTGDLSNSPVGTPGGYDRVDTRDALTKRLANGLHNLFSNLDLSKFDTAGSGSRYDAAPVARTSVNPYPVQPKPRVVAPISTVPKVTAPPLVKGARGGSTTLPPQTAKQKASIAQGALLSAHGARTNDWLEHRLNQSGADVDPGIADNIRALAYNYSADIKPTAYVKSGKGRSAWVKYINQINDYHTTMKPIIAHGFRTGKMVRDTTVSPEVQAMIASLGSKVKKTGNKAYDDNATMLAAIGAQIKNPGSGAVDPWQNYDPTEFTQKQALSQLSGQNQIDVAAAQQGGGVPDIQSLLDQANTNAGG